MAATAKIDSLKADFIRKGEDARASSHYGYSHAQSDREAAQQALDAYQLAQK